MIESIVQRYENATEINEIFGIVKDAVKESLNRERGGIMLGFSDLGINADGFIGGYHQSGSNAIILNSSVLKRLSKAKPDMLKPYAFSVLLHEYLHSLGVLNEARTRLLTFKICSDCFGESHPVTMLSRDFNKLGRDIAATGASGYPTNFDITFVDGFDSETTGYIG